MFTILILAFAGLAVCSLVGLGVVVGTHLLVAAIRRRDWSRLER